MNCLSLSFAFFLCICATSGAHADSATSQPASYVRTLKVTGASGNPGEQALALAKARADDAASAVRLTAEGKAIFEAASEKQSFGQYKLKAFIFLEKGDLREAIHAASVLLFMGEQGKDSTQVAFAKQIIAWAYLFAGDLDHARVYAEQAMAQWVHPYYRSDINTASLKIIGDIEFRKHNYQKAIEAYEKSADISMGTMRFYSRLSSATAYLKAKQPDKAEEALNKAEGYFGVIRKDEQKSAKGSLLRVRGALAIASGKANEAMKHYETALQSDIDSEDSAYERFWMLEGLALAKLALGDRSGAIKAVLEAVGQAEKVRTRFRSEEVKSGLFGDMQDVFGLAIRLLMEDGRAGDAWEVSERGKSRALLDSITNRVSLSSSSAVVSETSSTRLSQDALSSTLLPREVLASFHVTADRIFGWSVRKSGIQGFSVPIDQADLVKLVETYRDALVAHQPTSQEIGRKLYELLVKPLHLSDDESVVFAPHNVLHYLPFQSLWNGNRYLLQQVSVSYSPSATTWKELTARTALGGKRLYALGNPDLGDPQMALPGAQKEVEAIRSMFSNSEVYLQKEATRERLTQFNGQSQYLHIAAHGTADPVDPLSSKLHLTKTADSPGTVEARDIYSMKLHGTSLVALSACETGLGKVSRGNEVWGFIRSFLSAGAQSLLVSLWPVSDEATELLMTRFYTELLRGTSPGDSMRKAALAVMDNPKFSAPYYWAAFNLVGRSR